MSLLSSEMLFEKYFADSNHPLIKSVGRLLAISEYACRQVAILQQLLNEDDCQEPLLAKNYFDLVANLQETNKEAFAAALRRFRHRHFLRILLREQAGLATVAETMQAWSYCADALILKASEFTQNQLQQRYGVPIERGSDKPARLYILAMGKLGAYELNFSSDVDVIFAYSAAGDTNGAESIDNQLYFTKVVQFLMALLQDISAEGFVYRVDIRLRPNGDSGALVSSLISLENYYQEQGRDWERYAMIKARLMGEQEDWFERMLSPFVYRRYVDFSVIESLRSMKAMIEREVEINPRLDDIKRGQGGIREIEFIVQNIQLIRGGRIPALKQQSILAVMDVLKKEKLLSRVDVLKQAYLFMRQLENYVQAYNDQQTHSMPTIPNAQQALVLAMGAESWEKLELKLHKIQRIISKTFRSIMAKTDDYQDDNRLLFQQLVSLWQGNIESDMAANLLQSIGYQEAQRCYQLIHAFRHSPRCRRLTQAARLRLDRFIPLLLQELAGSEHSEAVLLQVMRLLDSIVARSAYLALLTERLSALQELLFWFANSSLLSNWIVDHPFLLEKLLGEEQQTKLPSRQELETSIKNKLLEVTDEEMQAEILRQFKLDYSFQAARVEMLGAIDAVSAGRFLALLAEVIVKALVQLAYEQLQSRYPEVNQLKSHFAIIAYGKLASREMNYHSDLDLVFLHNVSEEQSSLITRLTQKIIHMLTMRTRSGILYTVDTRLRPSGSSGLLVSSLSAFVNYQQQSAWTWEHQALIRARVLLGSNSIRQTFNTMKCRVLAQKRENKALREDVINMLHKIKQQVVHNSLKSREGGLLDLEFIVQYLVLAHGDTLALNNSHTLYLISQLSANNAINKQQYEHLVKAYRYLHRLLHEDSLKSQTNSVDDSILNAVLKVRQDILG